MASQTEARLSRSATGFLVALPLLQVVNLIWTPSEEARRVVSRFLETIASVTAAFVMARGVRAVARNRGEPANAWKFISLGLTFWSVGMVLVFVMGFFIVRHPPGVPDIFFFLFFPTIIAGLVLLPREKLDRSDRQNSLLDFGALSVVAMIFIWHLNLRIRLGSLLHGAALPGVFEMVSTLSDALLLLTIIGRLVLRVGVSREFLPVLLVVTGCFWLVTADLVQGYMETVGGYIAGSAIDLGWVLFGCFAGLGGCQLLKETAGGEAADAGGTRSRMSRATWTITIAYLWIGLVASLVVWSLFHHEETNTVLLRVGVAAAALLFLARQVRTLRDNARLHEELRQAAAELEAKVIERTAELSAQQDRLRLSEAKFRGIVETTREWLWSVDQAGRYTYSNPAIQQILGYSLDEFQRKGIELMHPEDRSAFLLTLQEKAERREGWAGWKLRWRHRDGGWRVLESNAVGIADETGKIVGFQGADREVTERIQAETALRESEERYRALFERSPHCVFVVDFEGTFLDVNPAVVELLGYSREEFLTGNLAALFSSAEMPRVWEALSEVRAGNRLKSPTEFRLRRKDGTLVDVETRASLVSRGGIPTGVQGVARDITEQKRAEAAVRGSAERALRQRGAVVKLATDKRVVGGVDAQSFQVFTETVAAAFQVERVSLWLVAAEGKELRCVDLFEVSPQKHSDGQILEISKYPRYFEALSRDSRVDASEAQRDPRSVEFSEDCLIRFGITSILDAAVYVSGRLEGVVCLEHVGERREWHPDETAFASSIATVAAEMLVMQGRERTEEALRESEAIRKRVFDTSTLPIGVMDAETMQLIDCNPATLKVYRAASREELIGKTPIDVSSEYQYDGAPSRERGRYFVDRALEEGSIIFEWQHQRSDGELWDAEIHLIAFQAGSRRLLQFALQDITDRRRAEEALRVQEERLRLALEATTDSIWDWDLRTNETYFSPRWFTMLGYQPFSIPSNFASWVEYTHDEDAPRLTRAVRVAIENNASCVEEVRMRASNEAWRWVQVRGKVSAWDESGRPARMSGTTSDITARKEAEERIRQQAALLEASHDAILVWSLDGGIQFMNSAAEELTGKTQREAGSAELSDILRMRSELTLRAAIQEVTTRGEWATELAVRTGSGESRDVASRWTLLKDGRGRAVSILITCNDITEKKRLEAQYLRAQRLESVGTLASGVAHDLNNILNPILIGIDLLGMNSNDEDTRSTLGMMRESARRGSETVKQLLTFARGTESQRGPVQPRHVVREIVRLIQQTFPKNIQIYTDVGDKAATVLADPSQMHQVLMNLCVNARDAMPDGGVLSISLENAELNEASANIHPKARATSYVVFKISDSGTGIPPEIVDRIFDPFFTTKPQGKGTGLGLATALGIVEGHNGFMLVESQPGSGTTFRIYIPMVHSPDVSEVTEVTNRVRRGAGELILIVDDEPAIVKLAETVLRNNGYATLTASGASEAIGLYERHADRLRMVVTDMMMPFGDGRQLITMLREKRTDLPIVAMSGVATEEFQRETLGRGAWAFIHKPFSGRDLLVVVSGVLERR